MPRNIRNGRSRARNIGGPISIKALMKTPLPSACVTHTSQTYPTRSAAESAFYSTVASIDEYNCASFAKCTHCNRHYVIITPVEKDTQLLAQQ